MRVPIEAAGEGLIGLTGEGHHPLKMRVPIEAFIGAGHPDDAIPASPSENEGPY